MASSFLPNPPPAPSFGVAGPPAPTFGGTAPTPPTFNQTPPSAPSAPQAPAAPYSSGWYVFGALVTGILLAGTRAAPVAAGILGVALIYQLNLLLEGK